jgi:hypothetical protein
MRTAFLARAGSVPQGADYQNQQTGFAWLLLCFALALHVADEALTGFLDVYNPTVLAVREKASWVPFFTFDFKIWLTGLVLAVVVLSILSRLVFRGDRWIRYLGYFFAIMMIGNALLHTLGTILGHTVESVHFARPMPGFYSSPFLLAASVYLLVRLRQSAPTASRQGQAAIVKPRLKRSAPTLESREDKNKRAQS